jgi:pyruvate/2-oxoglutarate dehydrogenase complex dihydrolipoamide dehydrogenase (E3) component
LQTSNPDVYAAGDICSPYKFTHTADAQARILIANALFCGRNKTSTLTIPWCTYTDPEIAHVGLYEEDASGKGLAVTTLTVALADIDRARLDGETAGFARIHLRQGTDKILGATIVARHAGEMINEFSLAISSGLGLAAIGKTIHPYPTQAEVCKRLADAYNRTRLTPLVQKLLATWLKWQRG